MAFVFSKDGTMVYTGSINNIEEHLADNPPAHAIIHEYNRIGFGKSWRLFGGDNAGLRLVKVSTKRSPYWLPDGYKHANRARWVLYDADARRIVASWRYLPSC